MPTDGTPRTEQSARLDPPHSGADHRIVTPHVARKAATRGRAETAAMRPGSHRIRTCSPGTTSRTHSSSRRRRTRPRIRPVSAAPPPPSGGRSRSTIVAVIAATAVVAAATTTGFFLLGSGEDNRAGTDPTKTASPQASPNNPQDTDTETATVKGWKVVVNPSQGIAFDVPPQWALQSTDWVTYVSENDDPDDTPLIGMRAPAYLKEQWCTSDEDKDGTAEDTPLAVAGSRGNNGARSTEEIAACRPQSLGVRAIHPARQDQGEAGHRGAVHHGHRHQGEPGNRLVRGREEITEVLDGRQGVDIRLQEHPRGPGLLVVLRRQGRIRRGTGINGAEDCRNSTALQGPVGFLTASGPQERK